jgi:flavin-binding protein dodecin
MAKIVKVIEVLSESPNSWEEAVQNVASEASKTLRNIRSIYVKEFTAAVEEGRGNQLSRERQGDLRDGAWQYLICLSLSGASPCTDGPIP